jgi:hypothetical protein
MPYVMKTEPPLPLRNGSQVLPRDRYPELGTWSGLAIDVRFVLQQFSILFFALTLSLSRSFVFFFAILFYILTRYSSFHFLVFVIVVFTPLISSLAIDP